MSVAKKRRTARNSTTSRGNGLDLDAADFLGQLVPALALADLVAEPPAPRLRRRLDPVEQLAESPGHELAVDLVAVEVLSDLLEVPGDRAPEAPVVAGQLRDAAGVDAGVVVGDVM